MNNMDEEQVQQPRPRRLATTYIDAVQSVVINQQIESKPRNGKDEYSRRIFVRTAGGSYLLILTSTDADALRFTVEEQKEAA
jgi:hypothetical protein